MRILSVVTLVTPDGAYGGPVRVAVNQASALIKRGHQVTLTAAVRGFGQPPTQLDGVPIRLFAARTLLPGAGFAGLAAPGMLGWLRGCITDFDVVHVHAARDLVTLPAAALARRAKRPLFLQTHGMIDPSGNPLAGPLDAVLTKPLLRAAAGVFHLTGFERDQLQAVGGQLRFIQLPNGVPLAEPSPAPAEDIEVLYLARLAPRKRPLAFVAAAARLSASFPEVRFTLIGPDEGEGSRVKAAIAQASANGVNISWEGALAPEETLERMRRASVYVLPSVDEPYPMTVLEALSIGRPVVITDTCGLADFVRSNDAGLVCDDSIDQLSQAIETLLSDPIAAEARGDRGRTAVRRELSMAAIAEELETQYQQALSAAPKTG